MAKNPEQALIIKFGGSIATTMEGANYEYLHSFLSKLIDLLGAYQRVGLVIGGGPRIRQLQATVAGDSAKNLIAREGLWEHAETLRTVAEDLGLATEPVPHTLQEAIETLRTQTNPVVVVSWLADGQSTDTSAIILAEEWQDQGYEATVVILSNVAHIFTADPRKVNDAQPILQSSVKTLVQEGVLLAHNFKPGMSVTIDPKGVEKLLGHGDKAPTIFFAHSQNHEDVRRLLEGEELVSGTLLKPQITKTRYAQLIT